MIEADQYLECSAKTGKGVDEVLEAAIQLTLQGRKKKKNEDNKQKKEDEKREKGTEDKWSSRFGNLFRGKA